MPQPRTLPIAPLIAAMILACGSDSPTGLTAGERMSVAEQASIEAALGKVANALEQVGRTPQDSVLADFTRIAARLILLQGQQGSATITAPGGGSPLGARAVYATAEAGAAGPGTPRVHLVVAWEGLNTADLTVRRALVMMSDAPAATGTFNVPATSSTAAARWIDFTVSPSAFYFNVDGSFSVSAPEFRGNCPGLPTGQGITCTTGRATVGGMWRGSRDDGATTPTISWDAVLLPAFRLAAD